MLDDRVEIAGAIDVERGEGWVRPWRLPVADLEFHHPDLIAMAGGCSGVRLRFRTAAAAIALDAEAVGYDEGLVPRYELVVDGAPLRTVSGTLTRGEVTFEDLPPGEKGMEIWLSQIPGIRVYGVRALDGAEILAPDPDPRPRWTVYGSSITHGVDATPARTWPAVSARLLGRNLTNLGYAGQCHLDPLVGKVIAAHPADHITLKLGINVHNQQSLRERTFGPAVHGLIATIRERQPYTPITLVSPIYSPSREASAVTQIGLLDEIIEGDLSLETMRSILRDVAEVRMGHGDQALHYLDGRELFGKDDLDHLPDGLHPDATGLRMMGERYAALSQ